jgi:hypothetical protein
VILTQTTLGQEGDQLLLVETDPHGANLGNRYAGGQGPCPTKCSQSFETDHVFSGRGGRGPIRRHGRSSARDRPTVERRRFACGSAHATTAFRVRARPA